MKIQEAYVKFLTLVNRNATNNNINVDIARFIMLFRDVELRFYDWLLNNRGSDTIRQAAHLLVPRKKLKKVSELDIYDLYELEKDYFEFSNLHVTATNGGCVGELHTEEVKSENIEEILTDEFSKPDFEYRETVYHLSEGNKIAIYKDDFSIQEVKMTYYKLPRQVSMTGYVRVDGTTSTTDVDPEWDEKTTYKILLYMAKDFAAMNEDSTKYQINKDSLFESLAQQK